MRDLSQELEAHLARPAAVRVFDMAFLDLETRPLYVHNDLGVIEWDGKVWYGLGDLGTVSEIVEDGLIAPGAFTVSLNGLRPEWIADARQERHISRRAEIYKAARNFTTGELDGEPHLWTRGTMQKMSMDVGDANAAISLRIEDARSNFRRSPNQYFSNDQQQEQNPGDTFFSFLDEAARVVIQWGERGQPAVGASAPAGNQWGFSGFSLR